MDYDKYVKIPMFIILDRNICVGNKLLYGMIMLLSHKEGYCYADNNYIIMEYKHKFQRKIYINEEKFTSDLHENFF